MSEPNIKIEGPCVISVEYHGDAKMVGKVVFLGETLVFIHAHTSSQWHRNTNCPSPVDVVVAETLELSELVLAPLIGDYPLNTRQF